MIISSTNPAAPGLFERIQAELLDDEGNAHTPNLLTTLYNRALDEIQPILMVLGAPIAMKPGTITGDGLTQSFELPADFRAFAVEKFLPRSPRDATADFSYGAPLLQVDDTAIRQSSTQAGDPLAFCLEVAQSGAQSVRFSCIPPLGYAWDYRYYPTLTPLTLGAAASTNTPWLGLLDPLINKTICMISRAGFEFVGENRERWALEARIDAVRLLGLRKLSERNTVPSIFDFDEWGR